MTSHVQDKILRFRDELSRQLIERSEEIDAVLTAILAQENILFVGPPGTAKTMLAKAVARWVNGKTFVRLLTKFSTPEEIFGPLKLSALKEDRFERAIEGFLPTADVAVLDEIWKANSAIVNTLLEVLLERTFTNGRTVVNCPLILAIAASNEWPQGGEMGAIFDRFTLRLSVKYIASPPNIRALLWRTSDEIAISEQISREELNEAITNAQAIPWQEEAKSCLNSIVESLRKKGIRPSDRRLRKARRVASAYAYLCGEEEVTKDSCYILRHVLWDVVEQQSAVDEIVGELAAPIAFQVNSLVIQANEVLTNADPADLKSVAAATRKLGTITKSLQSIHHPRAQETLTYLAEEIRRLKAQTVEQL